MSRAAQARLLCTAHALIKQTDSSVGIATDRLREEIGAAVFKAQARVILDRIRYCYRGNRAADARRHLQQARWRSRAEHARSHGRPRGRYSLLHRCPSREARRLSPAPRPGGRGSAASPFASRFARGRRQYLHRATM